MPEPLPDSEWKFPPPSLAGQDGMVATGGDLEPATLISAYRHGLFPMPLGHRLGWWSPDPRGVIPLDGLRVSRSLRRSLSRYDVTVDLVFADVVALCGDPRRPHGWISPPILQAYVELHRLGYAHSVEVWDDDVLVGGLYGVATAGLFAGESMFHHATDASKVALLALVSVMGDEGMTLLDVQWATDHLQTLGAIEIPRVEYLDLLADALGVEPADRWQLADNWRRSYQAPGV